MTLFAYFSMPLFVLFIVFFVSTIKSRDYQKLLSLFVISVICSLPIVSVSSFIGKYFFPGYDFFSVYLRVLVISWASTSVGTYSLCSYLVGRCYSSTLEMEYELPASNSWWFL